MKNKFLIFVSILSLFVCMNNVKADTTSFNVILDTNTDASSYNVIKKRYEDNSDKLLTLYNSLYEEYTNNYKSSYPYYIIYTTIINERVQMVLRMFDDISNLYLSDNKINYQRLQSNKQLFYENVNGSYILPIREIEDSLLPLTDIENFYYHSYFYSNFDLKAILPSNKTLTLSFSGHSDMNIVLHNNDTIPTFQSILGLNFINDPDNPSSNYTTINLNENSYVVLSLKDYSKTEEFETSVRVKGQYCLTPVYNQGLTEKKDVITGSKNQRCSPYYEDFTPVRTYILKSDLENKAIYYLKAYDTSKENIVKVDTSIFNIHLISEEEKNNPIINVNGKNVSIKSYDELTDSATISEEEGYNSGTSCAVGDFNCTAAASGSFSFSDIFTSPIDFLKNVWSSIVKVFELVTMLIVLLPTPVQYFFYISFTLAIVLGLIKIIL